MLAGMRSCFLLFLLFLLAFFVAACLPVQAQINGVPPSVTSIGFGGSNNLAPGIRPSVTSLGPNGYGNSRPLFGNCCANLFLPANSNPPLFSGRHHRRHGDRATFPVGVIVPAYNPSVVPYAPESDDDSDDADYVHAPGQQSQDARAGDRYLALKADAFAKTAEPVATQPSTVLVFKDGHQSDVINYAIVGDTLFDFAGGRTRKILLADLDLLATQKLNDDRGVDFQIPASATW